MTKRKPDVYLHDILESIEYIEQFLKGVSEEDFYKNVEKAGCCSTKIGSYRRSRLMIRGFILQKQCNCSGIDLSGFNLITLYTTSLGI